jgi:hypothetical protein
MVVAAIFFCSALQTESASSWSGGTQARTLYGVTIGENAAYALAGLGLKPPRWHEPASPSAPKTLAEYRLALADYGRAFLQLVFDTRIKNIMVYQYGTKEPNIVDPYGIKLNDTVARLTKKRGRPSAINSHHDYVYGSWPQLHWVYATHGGLVTSISVSDGPP